MRNSQWKTERNCGMLLLKQHRLGRLGLIPTGKGVGRAGKGQITMGYERIDSRNRQLVNSFLKEHWYTTTMVIRGKEIDMTQTEGFYLAEKERIFGLITYMVYEDILEITSLNSLRENQGIGSELTELVVREAKERGLRKVVLITTNDNINAIRFYQKRGFDMARLFRNALEASRRLKPEIPLLGENDIPLRHEIEFELLL